MTEKEVRYNDERLTEDERKYWENVRNAAPRKSEPSKTMEELFEEEREFERFKLQRWSYRIGYAFGCLLMVGATIILLAIIIKIFMAIIGW